MNRTPSQLIDLSDYGELIRTAEVKRELMNAYDRIENLQDAIKGLLALLVLIGYRPDVSPELRDILKTNHRVIDAQELLR